LNIGQYIVRFIIYCRLKIKHLSNSFLFIGHNEYLPSPMSNSPEYENFSAVGADLNF